MVGVARNPQYVVEAISLATAEAGRLMFQNIGYIKVLRFQTDPNINNFASVVLDGQINFSLGDIQRGNPIPLLYNNEVRFPEGAARMLLSWPAQSGRYAIVCYSDDPNVMDLDTPNPKQLVTSALGAAIAGTNVGVTNAATLLTAADTTRFSVSIQNLDASNPIYIGPSTVTTANGFQVAPNGGVAVLSGQTAAIYGIAAVAGPLDVRVLVEKA